MLIMKVSFSQSVGARRASPKSGGGVASVLDLTHGEEWCSCMCES